MVEALVAPDSRHNIHRRSRHHNHRHSRGYRAHFADPGNLLLKELKLIFQENL